MLQPSARFLRAFEASRGLLLGCALVLGTAQPAFASPTFPGLVDKQFDLACTPSCTICHTEDPGRSGTTKTGTGSNIVDVAFAGSLKDARAAAWLVAGVSQDDVDDQRQSKFTDDELIAALEQVAADATDSDGDGQTDVEELAAGTDPSRKGAGPICVPSYGCGAARIAPEPPSSSLYYLALVAMGGVGLLAGRRLRRVRAALRPHD